MTGSAAGRSDKFEVQLRDLRRGRAGHMTTTKASSRLLAGGAGMGPKPREKIAVAQGDKPLKAARRLVPKASPPKVLGDPASTAIPPSVILWDDPVDPATSAKLK